MGRQRRTLRERAASFAGRWPSVVAALLAAASTVIAAYISVLGVPEKELNARRLEQLRASTEVVYRQEFDRLRRELDMAKTELDYTRRQLAVEKAKAGTPGAIAKSFNTSVSPARIGALERQVSGLVASARTMDDLSGRLTAIEKVVVDNPQKAIALAAFRKDLDGLQAAMTLQLEQLKRENDRMYDLTKWIVGIMSLVSVSLIGVALGNVLKKPEAKSEGRNNVPPESAG
jgi:hypothetical protein